MEGPYREGLLVPTSDRRLLQMYGRRTSENSARDYLALVHSPARGDGSITDSP